MTSIFKYETLRSYAWDDDLEKARAYHLESKEHWEKHLKEVINKPDVDKKWIKQIKHYIKQADRGLETLRLIDEEDFETEQRKLLCNKVEEISKKLYYDMFECLPPMFKHGASGFFMIERLTGTITSQFWQDGDKYYHAFADLTDETTWH